MMERFEAAVHRAGVKLTPQRIAIYREVARRDDHPDIEAIFRNVRREQPSVSLDTVYRALALFSGLGLVTMVRPRGYNVRFDANTNPHHHFVCTRCGATLDFEYRDFDALRIPESASALGRVDSRHVELRGLCARCASGSGPAATAKAANNAHHQRGTSSHRAHITKK